MNTNEKLLKAVEQAEETLNLGIGYCTDDSGKLTYLFPTRAPGLKMYASEFSKPIPRLSVAQIAAEIVADFSKQTGLRPVGRPSLNVKRIAITLTPELRQKAEEIGNGNASDGIRKALEAWS